MNTPDQNYIVEAIRSAMRTLRVLPDAKNWPRNKKEYLDAMREKFRAELARADMKISTAVQHARECSRHTWQMAKHRPQYRQVKREAMQDARYWQAYRDTLKTRSASA